MISKFIFLNILISSVVLAVDFNRDIKPILSKKCFSCHGKSKQKGKLRLDLRDDALNKKAFIPHKASESELFRRITSKDPDEIMPPPDKESLNEKEAALIKKWLDSGANYSDHWAFEPLSSVTIPKTKDSWPESPIDSFVLQKLNEAGLKPKDAANKLTLIRRLSLILTGLPPEEKLHNDFLNNKIPYEKAVQKLLDSDAFGEHFATFWLDGARYADTNGIEYDNSRPIWPYRDWVIKALNSNMPYDQFVIEQLAGDLLENSTVAQQVATGFNRCNQSTNEQGSLEEEFLVTYAKDRLNTTASVFMGLTVKCAECHDHKYDPVSQKEYYQLLSYFNNIEGVAVGYPFDRSDPPLVPVISDQKNRELNNLEKEIENLEAQMQEIKKTAENDFFFWHYSQLSKPPKAPFIIAKLDSYFAFNEESGNTAFNLITEHNCNIKGIMSRTLGKRKNGLKFRASSSVDCLDLSNYEKDQPFTVGSWIKPEENCEGVIIARYNAELRKGWKLRVENRAIQLVLSSGNKNKIVCQSEQQIPLHQWTHVSASYNGNGDFSGLTIFINGKPASVKNIQNNLGESIKIDNNLRIGLDTHMDGLIHASLDEVFSGKGALDSESVQAIMNFSDESRFALVEPSQLTGEAKSLLFNYYLENFHDKYSNLFKKARTHKNNIQSIFIKSQTSMVMKERKNVRPTHILNRGDYQSPGAAVQRNTPKFLNDFNPELPNNRLGFAKWLTDPAHPLTARVFVNRIWQEVFGKGIVSSVDDFGLQGEYPSHPKLLDHLSNYFIRHGWDTKKLITYLVNSSTFKQRSFSSTTDLKVDPNNTLYSRFPRRRMKAEIIRDQALFMSGLMNNSLGGAPVFPYQPKGLWQDVTADISNTYIFKQDKGKNNYRRSIYTFWKRNAPPPSMLLLDAPSRQSCSMKRNISNTPMQALLLLNDPQFVELHKQIALTVSKLKLNSEETIVWLYRKILFRTPGPYEKIRCIEFLKHTNDNYLALVQTLMNLDEFLTIE